MFIVKILDTGEIEHYNNLEDVYMNCEGIDVNNGLYEFSDVDGNIYDVEWIEEIETEKILFGLIEVSGQGKYILKRRN